MLLRNLNTCKIDANNQSYRQTYHLALGFVMRLSLLASDVLKDIFEEIRTCCGASRQTAQTPKLMGNLASFLGQILAEIRHLRRHAQSYPEVSPTNVVASGPQSEELLTSYSFPSFGFWNRFH